MILELSRLPLGIPKSMIIISDSNNYKNNDNYSSETGMNLYPNPTSDIVTLYVDLNVIKNITTIELLNSKGFELKKISGIQNSSKYKIDLRDYPNGVYYCIIKSDNQVITKKVIKITSD
jgi:hypothetical protein